MKMKASVLAPLGITLSGLSSIATNLSLVVYISSDPNRVKNVEGFQSFKLPQIPQLWKFDKAGKNNSRNDEAFPFEKKTLQLLKAVSNTNNGKTATLAQQQNVLQLVREIETFYSPEDITTILSDPNKINALDGVWYLQYTSPSIVGDKDEFPDVWKPSIQEDPKIETKQFQAQGSVTATGITVDTSNRVVKQIFDIQNSRVVNEVDLDFGMVTVGGTFKASDKVPNRVLVAFKECTIALKIGPVLKLGFIFSILSKIRGTEDSGWLETTFLGPDMRIGRGNKGTMFILTRDADAVQP